ncbi:hypothetical protein AB0M64_23610 [Streptomyces sp. NPDC051771]|uniref:hypothetical protein n=1 Tax=Streptomyces sp. NPDC051771 TaxID=3154847 RepID=UPI00343C2595
MAALIASLLWVAGRDEGRVAPRTMVGVVSHDGPVRDLADAESAAERFADRWDLRVGEIMRFTNGYYAELLTPDAQGATEVLIDPDTGTVRLEFGPAMMWNTEYGMMPGRARDGAEVIGPEQAVRVADQWLREHRPSLRAGEPEAFPGYYTLRGDDISGMLSVDARSGTVWYHTWHGRFLQMTEPADTTERSPDGRRAP